MLHQQNPTVLFDLSRDQHERLLQAATEQRLLNQVTAVASPVNLLLQWLRGQSQTPVIQKIPEGNPSGELNMMTASGRTTGIVSIIGCVSITGWVVQKNT